MRIYSLSSASGTPIYRQLVDQASQLAQPDGGTGFFGFTPCPSDLECSGGHLCYDVWGQTSGVCL